MSERLLSPLGDPFLHLGRLEYASTQYDAGTERFITSFPPAPQPQLMDLPQYIEEGSSFRISSPQLNPTLDIHTVFSQELEVIDLRNARAIDLIDPEILCSLATNPPVNQVIITHHCLAEKVIVPARDTRTGVMIGDILLTLVTYLQSWKFTGRSWAQMVEYLRGASGYILRGFSVDQGTTLRLHVGGVRSRSLTRDR